MMKLILKITVLLGIAFGFASAYAEDSEFADIARERRYVGGADESDLKVQKTVSTDPKKQKAEVSEESSEGF